MTLMWRLLIQVTGQIGSFLILQLGIFCLALYGLSLFIYRSTGRPSLAMLVYSLAILPGVLTIAGVLWKDVSMAFALMLACTLFLLAVVYVHIRWAQFMCIGLGCLLLVYAGTLRYNAIFAIVPLLALVPRLIGANVAKWTNWAICAGGVGVVVLVGYVLSLHSEHTYPVTAIMLDDIVHVAPEMGSQASQVVYGHIRSVCNTSTSEIMDSYVLCTNEKERNYIKDQHGQVIRDWLSVVTKHPLAYMRYRVSVFAIFLFPDMSRMYIYQDGVVDNDIGIAPPSYLNRALGAYINGFAKTNFAFIFQPWFWFIVLLLIVYYTYRQKRTIERSVVLAAAVSGLLYGLLYVIATVATDYRYIYWLVLAALFCMVVICGDRLKAIGAKKYQQLAETESS
jgi:hypothetical protein